MKVRGSARISRPRGSVNKIQPTKVNMLYHLILSGNFLGSEIRHGIFWGKFLVQELVGFVGRHRDFFWVLIFAPIRSSPSLEIGSTPPPPGVGTWYANKTSVLVI